MQETLPSLSPRSDASPFGRKVAGRFVCHGPLERGGSSRVEWGEDTLTGARVAIKWIPLGSARTLEQARREVTTLRWLAVPGVVRFIDDGVEDGHWYIVMEQLSGAPFPGAALPVRWERLRPVAVGLLEVLARVHHAGIVHGDLKPGNVYVGATGGITVLDFGIATGRLLPPVGGMVAGTPRHMAPESWEGTLRDVRADLYAVGVMLLEALTNALQPAAADTGDAPEEVAALLRRLVAPAPADRPASAAEVLDALGAAPEDLRFEGEATIAGLAPLFAGPELFLHHPSEAARVLGAVCGGDPRRVGPTLASWERAGIVHRDDGLYRVDRLALEALDERPDEAGLRAMLRANADPSTIVAEAIRLADLQATAGHVLRTIAALELALPLARASKDMGLEAGLLARWSVTGLGQESPFALRRARCEIGRCARLTPQLAAMDALLHALEAVLAGQGALAEARLLDAQPLGDEELEIWRAAIFARAARHQHREAESIAELEAWAITPYRRARWSGWLGALRYRQGRYAEAAELHLAAAAVMPTEDRRLGALRNAAFALLELGELARVHALLREVAERARALGHALLEAHATVGVRMAEYRAGHAGAPRLDLVEGAAAVAPFVAALCLGTEAAVAWRGGDLALTVDLAERAARGFTSVGERHGGVLFRALVCAARGADAATVAAVAAEADGLAPDFAVQTLGLLRLANAAPDPGWRLRALEKAAARPREQWANRLDVLSFEEALDPCWRL